MLLTTISCMQSLKCVFVCNKDLQTSHQHEAHKKMSLSVTIVVGHFYRYQCTKKNYYTYSIVIQISNDHLSSSWNDSMMCSLWHDDQKKKILFLKLILRLRIFWGKNSTVIVIEKARYLNKKRCQWETIYQTCPFQFYDA